MAAVLAGLILTSACGGEKEECGMTPGEGSLSGYYPVTIDCPGSSFSAADISSVKFGENSAIKIQVLDPHTVSATVQGASQPGKVDVRITHDGKERVLKSVFTYLPPADPIFDRMFALGASWTMGVQSGSLNPQGQLYGLATQLARSVGAYFPLPLVKFPLPTPIQAADLIGNCSPEDLINIQVGDISEAATYILQQEHINLASLREDPDTQVNDLGIGGARIHDVIYGGGNTGRIDIAFVENLVYSARAPLTEIFMTPEIGSQLEVAEARHPTLIMITDLFGNDLAPAVLKAGLPDPTLSTPLSSFQADTRVLLSRLSATGAEVFIGNLGNPITLPWLKEKVKVLAHEYTQAQIEQIMTDIATKVDRYTATLAQEASVYSNIHIVDLGAAFAKIDENGVTVGETHLTTSMFGGLISLDGIHPSHTGYAMYANTFLEAINAARGLNLPMVDLVPVMAEDPYSPAALRAAGLDPDLCR